MPKKAPAPKTKTAAQPDVAVEQQHKGCGGRLVICASKTSFRIVCTTCITAWEFSIPFFNTTYPLQIPEDWENNPLATNNLITANSPKSI